MEKIDNIKELYQLIDKKTAFIQLVADDLKLSAQYLRGHYFSTFWSIPEDKQERIIYLLQNTIKGQKEFKQH